MTMMMTMCFDFSAASLLWRSVAWQLWDSTRGST